MVARQASPQLMFALLLGVGVAACDGTTATDPQLSKSASPAKAPATVDDVMVPYFERLSSAPAPDALPVVCEPAFAGVILPNSLVAAGVATHLGKVTGTITGTSCAVDVSGIVSIGGLAQRIAANGDVLDATWTGTIAGGALTLSVTFTGGSGRFQNASGWATGEGTVDPSGVSEWTLTGRITPPLN